MSFSTSTRSSSGKVTSPFCPKEYVNFEDPEMKQLEKENLNLIEELFEANEKLEKTTQENEDLKKDIKLLEEDVEDIRQNRDEILANPPSPNSRKKLETIAKDVMIYSKCMVNLVVRMLGLLDESDKLHEKMNEFQDGIINRYQDENDEINKQIHDQFDVLSQKIVTAKEEFKRAYIRLKELSLEVGSFSIQKKLYISKSAIKRLDVIIEMAERVNIK